jgi:hypothetical protein
MAPIGDHKAFPTSAIEAVVLSPAVLEQFQVDACARRFVICDPEIDSANVRLFRKMTRDAGDSARAAARDG